MVNEAAASIIGLPAASLTGHPVTNIIPKTKTLLEECFRCVRNGEPLADQQLAWQGRHYQLIFGVLRDQSFIGLSIAVIDVTRRTHIERHLRESRRRLRSGADMHLPAKHVAARARIRLPEAQVHLPKAVRLWAVRGKVRHRGRGDSVL